MVDDSDVTRAMVVRLLQRAGFETSTATDGVVGVLEAMRNPPDIVVSDLEMTTLDGSQLARCLKTDPATRHLPVIILTSHEEARARFWSLETGADAYLIKGGDPGELVTTVERLLAAAPKPDGRAGTGLPDGPLDVLARVVRALDDNLLESVLSQSLLAAAAGAASLEDAVRAVLDALARVVDCHALAVALESPAEVVVFVSTPAASSADSVSRLATLLGNAVGLTSPDDLRLVELGPASGGGPDLPLDGLVMIPLPARSASAILGLIPRRPREWAHHAEGLVQRVVHPLGLALDNAHLSDRLRDLSAHDGLTRLLNHRTIFERLREEVERSNRYGGELSILLADIDHFKQVNDGYGHPVGDSVLRRVATALRQDLRACDALGRYGGEEFLAVLPSTPLAGASGVAERMRCLVEDARTELSGGDLIQVTASFGVASLAELDPPGRAEDLVNLADRRLYAAKRAGRNRVTSIGGTPEP